MTLRRLKINPRWLLLIAAIGSCAVSVARESPDEFSKVREQFVEAYARVNSAAPEPDSDALRAYPLYPYLEAARLRRDLLAAVAPDQPVDAAAAAFLTQHGREPVTRDVRSAWLNSLAARRQWATFVQQYREPGADDELRCQYLIARIELNQLEGLPADISKQWLTPQSVQACEVPFTWLRTQGGMSVALIEQRVKLALDKGNTGFAKQIIAYLPKERATPYLQWAALIDNPRSIDTLIADPQLAVDPEVQLATWKRLTRVDRDGAFARYDRLVAARQLDEAKASPYALALALSLAWERRPEALDYFKLVRSSDFDDNAREWQIRSALWIKDWALVSKLIAALPGSQRETARWRYWSARAAEHSQDPQLARRLYESVIIDDNYYAAMASARLERHVVPHLQQVAVDKAQLRDIEQLPGLIRARELFWSNLRPYAQIEWMVGYESLSEPARAQAIHLARNWGWYDQAVTVASQQRLFNDYELLYPQPYDREVKSAATLTQLPEELIYGVLRQESLYRPDAISSAGARGLLQLLPETARRTAQQWKRTKPTPDQLLDPAVNVPLGAAQLRMLMDQFGGQTVVALAGYNAGPSAARRWLPNESIDSDIWIENIPYNETRAYVQRILWHSVVFGWLRTGEAQRTENWIARVSSSNDAAVLGLR
jgi:soluble lytic murein transglycosylase